MVGKDDMLALYYNGIRHMFRVSERFGFLSALSEEMHRCAIVLDKTKLVDSLPSSDFDLIDPPYYSFTITDVLVNSTLLDSFDVPSFSISLVDRFNVNWTSGDKVPVYAQKQGSLGRKVRGYASYSYNSELTIVNNLDLRFTSPALGVDGLYIRLNLFFDMGYGAGHFYNSEFRQNKFIASTGAQISFTIFDFIDLGYQVAWLLGDGYNFSKGDTSFSGSFTFFLDF